MNIEKFIQVYDCLLYTHLSGNKSSKPTLVMEAGYGNDSHAWDSVINELSTLTEVFVYDRAGLGQSEKTTRFRTSREMTEELKELVKKVKIKTPFILVGHSFGGVIARLYATMYPDDVCGMVLVDSTPENYRERFLPTMNETFQQAYEKQFIYESNAEEFTESLNKVKKSRKMLDIPLVVLSAGKKAHYSSQSQELWHEMQREMLTISTKPKMIIAKNSSHYIQDDEPGLIIKSVQYLLDNDKPSVKVD
ncbi:alpha/beta fold hydrolase [Metabacillus sp. HB246100]|uniref:alpha/beta fold hydrolase n=1 Tax=Bacillus weihaiensis TaxID=1547283 RepID=UPI0023561605|nr:alpha/beta hydrolase [Bacillus weihaiensis]